MVNCLVSPLFMVLATRSAATALLGVPLWAYMAVLGVLLCALVFFLTDLARPPRLHWAFAYFGFAVSIAPPPRTGAGAARSVSLRVAPRERHGKANAFPVTGYQP